MKKILSVVVLVAALAMISCAGNNNKKATKCEAATCEQCDATCDTKAECAEATKCCDKAECTKSCDKGECKGDCSKGECKGDCKGDCNKEECHKGDCKKGECSKADKK